MKARFFIFFFPLLLWACASSGKVKDTQKIFAGQYVDTETRKAVLRDYLSAIDPEGNAGKFSVLRMAGTYISGDVRVPVYYRIIKDRRLGIVMSYAGEDRYIVKYPPEDSLQKRPLAPDDRLELDHLLHRPFTGLFGAFLQSDLKMYALPDTVVFGKPVKVFLFSLPPQTTWKFYLDKQHGTVLKREKFHGDKKTYILEMMDFRPVKGILFPYKWEWHENGIRQGKIFWKKIQVQ